ncbi:putative Mg2+ transporter-C (MgtC) family protein [Rhizobium sp. RU20A]|uniref:MgtC/SapB family protein n=1 Tax=Rhizobium sp. RU20A TaxID=1907412 RepID=UPI000954EBD9|nr:MgtC/SapB family protein [Rhizobium sp. RU20A]SIR26633.1 putative Mg2+ transporter-C (MgtC) family protein [Rhizobium sp. RU20A]
MPSSALDIFADHHLPLAVVLARLVLALACGAAIGIEREWRQRPAGLRTHILVCLAASLASIVSIEITHLPAFAGQEIRIDPLRIIEAVTAGVAFLAAGTIVFSRGTVQGLTTGAGMWLAGVTGLAAGLGLWQIALVTTLLAVAVLSLIRLAESGTSKKSLADKSAEKSAETSLTD